MKQSQFGTTDTLDLLDALDAIVYVADLETFELLYLNKTARELFGNVVGQTCWKVLQADQTEPCRFCTNDQLFNADGTPAEPYVWEFQNTLNGEWWECRDRAIKWTDGRYVRMEIAVNITERKKVKEQLRENGEKYRTLYENSPSPYQSLNERGELIDVNPAWLRLLGYSRDEVIGRSVSELLHPEWQPHFSVNFPEFKKRGEIKEIHFRIQHKEGHYLDILVDGQAGYSETGEFKQTYCVFQDITERIRAEKRLLESERKFRLLADVTHDWEYWIDPDGSYKYVSPSCEKMTGISAAELIANPEVLFEVIASEDLELVKHHYTDHAEKRAPAHTIEFSIIARDGTRRVLEHFCAPVYDDEGNFTGRNGNNRDITERKNAEEKIRASEERLSFALKGAKCGLWDWNIVDNRVHFDENYYRMAGYLPNEFPQSFESWEERVHPDDVVAAKQRLQHYLAGEADKFSTEFRFRRKDGGWIWILGQGEIVEWQEDGAPLRMAGLHIDIDDSKQAEVRRMELEQQLRQKFKMEAVGTMAGGIAHNFNNSLAVILGSLEMAQRKIDDEERVEGYLATAKTAALRSRDLVQQILNYSRLEAQEKKPVKIATVLDETQKMLRPTIPSSIDFHCQIFPDCFEVMVEASSGQIQEAILNLSNNAVQAMKGRGSLQITLERAELTAETIPVHSPCQPGSFACIRVKDGGGGIEPELEGKIFDPFFTTKGVDEGTGIGLATVQGIMKQHDGLVTLINSFGQGCCFELYFPLRADLVDPAAGESQDIPDGGERILFVDDESQLAEVSRQMLTDLGYLVTAETSSTEALEMLRSQPESFDLLITDQTMPELTGKDLALAVHQFKPELPIILCTGYSNMVSADDAAQYGISAYCSKPLQLNELAQTIRRVLDG